MASNNQPIVPAQPQPQQIAPMPPMSRAPVMDGQTSCALYVGNLDSHSNESDLYKLFNIFEGFVNAKICRDHITRRSLGYAYVNFSQRASAEAALKKLNYTSLRDKEIRIMWSERDPSKRRSTRNNIFIAGLDKQVSNKALHDTFAQFGTVLSCIVRHVSSRETGVGFVLYERSEDAAKAIAKTNQKQILEKTIHVSYFKTKKEREQNLEQNFKNVFFKNLPADTTSETLKEMCQKFGTVTSVFCKKASPFQAKGQSEPVVRAFGFVMFETSESAHKAVEELNDKLLEDGQVLFAGRAQKKSEREARGRRAQEDRKKNMRVHFVKSNLYVKNLDEKIDHDGLKALFADFGTVKSVKVARGDNDISRGFGFVCMSTQEEATKAIEGMHGKMIEGRPLYVALHQTKEDRTAMFVQRQHAAMSRSMNMPPQQYMMQPPMMNRRNPQAQAQYMQQQRFSRGPAMPGQPPMAHMAHQQQMQLQMQKTYLSNAIFNKIAHHLNANPGAYGIDVNAAAKLTGMIIEQPLETLGRLLQNEEELHKQIADAAVTLKSAGSNNNA